LHYLNGVARAASVAAQLRLQAQASDHRLRQEKTPSGGTWQGLSILPNDLGEAIHRKFMSYREKPEDEICSLGLQAHYEESFQCQTCSNLNSPPDTVAPPMHVRRPTNQRTSHQAYNQM